MIDVPMFKTMLWPHAASETHQQLLTEFLDRLRALNFSPDTQRCYRLAVTHFLNAYPNAPLEKMTVEQIERHIYGRPISPRSQVVELMGLRSFFKFLVLQKHLMRRNPCEKVERPRWTERTRPAVSWEEFEALRRQCRTIEEACLLELYFFTGVRLREAITLRVRQVDLTLRRIRLVGKGGKERVVVFPERTAHLLRVYLDGCSPDAWLFPSRQAWAKARGHPRSDTWVGQMLARLGRAAGLQYHLTPHLLRHGFVRMCKLKGVPLDVAAKLLGHNSIITTSKLYGRLDVSDLQTVYDRLIGG
ncbi:MAG: tyrosine-type recombinase/integrase [Armatimonadota bacterium]